MKTFAKLSLALLVLTATAQATPPLGGSGVDMTPQTSSPIPAADYGIWVKSADKLLRFNSAGTSNLVPNAVLTTKGDLVGFTGAAFGRFAAGADGTCLKADSTQALGLSWGACGGGATPTLQQTYDAGAAGAYQLIQQSGTNGYVQINQKALWSAGVVGDSILTLDSSDNIDWYSFNIGRASVWGRGIGANFTTSQYVRVINGTPAANGAQQYSPTLVLSGAGYNPLAAASQPVEFGVQTQATQQTSTPTGQFVVKPIINGVVGGSVLTLDSASTNRLTSYATGTSVPANIIEASDALVGGKLVSFQTGGIERGYFSWNGSYPEYRGTSTVALYTTAIDGLYADASGVYSLVSGVSRFQVNTTFSGPYVDNTYSSGAATARWTTVYGLGVNAGTSTLTLSGTAITPTANFYPSVDSTYSSGLLANRWASVYTLAVDADGGPLNLRATNGIIANQDLYPSSTTTYDIGRSNRIWQEGWMVRRAGVQQNITAAASITLDPAQGEAVRINLNSDITTVNGVVGYDNEVMIVEIVQAGGHTITGWASGVNGFSLQNNSYVASPTAGAVDTLTFVFDHTSSKWVETARRQDTVVSTTTTLQQAYTAMPASAPATVVEDSTRQWIQLNDYSTWASEPTGRYLFALDSSDNIDWYSFAVEQAVMWAQNIGATYPRTTKYMLFDNATAATAGAPQQWGIPVLLQARAWNTSTLTSQSIFMGLQARSNSSAPTDGYLAILGTYNNSVDLASPIAEFHTGQTNFLRSFVASTGSAVALALDTGNTLASGDKLVSVRNNTTEKFYVDYNGNLWANGASVTLGASPTINAVSGTLSLSATGLLWTTGQLTWTESANATTGVQGYLFTGGAHTAQPASTEKSDWDWNLARTVQWSTGALTTQRFMRMRQPTIAFVGASTVTDAATFAIDGAPVAGTNATLTNSWALMTSAGASLHRQDSISTAQTQTLVLQNRTAATNGAQQYSPAITLGGSGWSLLSSVTRDVRFVTQAQPTQVASNEPGADLVHYLVVNNATTGANISSTQAFAVRISGDVTQQSYIELFNKNGSSLFKLGAITAQQALLNAKLSPSSDGLFDLGTTALRWGTLFVGGITGNANSMTIANGVSNSAAAKAFIFNASTTLSTSGAEIATFQTGGTEVGSFRLRTNGWGLDVVGQGVLTTGQADGASSVGWTINTTTAWSNATSKLLSIQTNSVEKAFILSSGGASFPLATLSAGGQLYTSGSAPTLAAGTGAGTSPTTSYSGTDAAGVLTVTTGTAPASFNATIVTLTFNSTRSAAPRAVVIQAANANAAALTGATMVFADSTTFGTTGWALKSGSSALTAATTYTWNVWVVN